MFLVVYVFGALLLSYPFARVVLRLQHSNKQLRLFMAAAGIQTHTHTHSSPPSPTLCTLFLL